MPDDGAVDDVAELVGAQDDVERLVPRHVAQRDVDRCPARVGSMTMFRPLISAERPEHGAEIGALEVEAAPGGRYATVVGLPRADDLGTDRPGRRCFAGSVRHCSPAGLAGGRRRRASTAYRCGTGAAELACRRRRHELASRCGSSGRRRPGRGQQHRRCLAAAQNVTAGIDGGCARRARRIRRGRYCDRCARRARPACAQRDPDARRRSPATRTALDVDAGDRDRSSSQATALVTPSRRPTFRKSSSTVTRVGPRRQMRHRLAGFDDERRTPCGSRAR